MRIKFLVVTTLLLGACGEYQEMSRQLPTFANMQSVARQIQRIHDRDGSISDEAALRIVMNMNHGRDAWGHRIVYASKTDPDFSFVLISPGKDGIFERDAPDQYFDAPNEDIVGRFDRDIVFRDAEPVTIASAK